VNEQERVEKLAGWYLTEQLDFDKTLIQMRYRSLRPHLRGRRGLELGSAEGEMTQYLRDDFDELTVVEGSAELLAQIPDYANVRKHHSTFEEYEPAERFNCIIMEHILEHVDAPHELLSMAKRWLLADGCIIVGVPNGHSFHRLVAVKMGLLSEPCELNERDLALGHRRVYTPQTFRQELEAAGLRVKEMGGVFFKTMSNKQINEFYDARIIEGFYELGKDFPQNAAELYAVCSLE
jgi:trans-aconitate methyltransferase